MVGLGIFVIVVGGIVGGVMLASPSGIWWATESWKFRNPEANEPSEIAYGMTRAGGLVLIIGALVIGGIIISDDLDTKHEREALEQRQAAEAAFIAPPPENRGPLPVIGVFTEHYGSTVAIKAYYMAPVDAPQPFIAAASPPGESSYPCTSKPTVTTGTDSRVSVNPQLNWAPTKLGDIDNCRLGNRHRIHEVTIRNATPQTPIITDTAIVTADGSQITPAAPGNVVPILDRKPDTSATFATVSDRGAIPIIKYQITLAPENGKRYLDIRYMVPSRGGAGTGSLSHDPIQGCEITPTITGQDTDTITVNLRLRWSNARGHYDSEDDANCNTRDLKPSIASSRWIDVVGLPTILTDGPVADSHGTIVMPAAPGNRVPERRSS